MIDYLKGIKNLPKALSAFEKLVVLVLLLVVLGTAGLWRKHITRFWQVQPVKGGSYSEGIVSQQGNELDQIITKLTRIGLTYIDHKGSIHGALAERWEISSDGKKYTFFLRPSVKAQDISEIYKGLPNWQNIDIAQAENNSLVITLKQAFSPLLSFTSEPVIDMGPYTVEKETKNEIVFLANKNFVLGEPNLQRIILTVYPDERALKAALQRQEVMGAGQAFKGIPGTTIKKLKLTAQNVLIFNLDKSTFNDKEIRERIRDNKKLDQPMTAVLVTTQDPELLKTANEFAQKAQKIGLTVSVKSVNSVTMDREILPNDSYDLLVTTINYGYDEDPYPYWHSSQILNEGKNYAGYSSKDADKLIEDARQTLDENERKKKYEEFKKILEADVPAIFYPNQEFSYTIAERLKGVSVGIGAVPSDRYTEVWQWYLKAKKKKT